MDGIWSRACAVLALALAGTLCAAAPALATDGYVKGKKWHDVNANGVKDSGEPVVKDWWIYVDVDRDGVYDSGEPQAKTDASGNYSITAIKWWVPNHEPRTYDVREKTVSGQPQPLDGCSYPAGCKHTLTFKYSSHQFSGKDFGNYKTGKVIVKKVNVGGDQADAFGSRRPAPASTTSRWPPRMHRRSSARSSPGRTASPRPPILATRSRARSAATAPTRRRSRSTRVRPSPARSPTRARPARSRSSSTCSRPATPARST